MMAPGKPFSTITYQNHREIEEEHAVTYITTYEQYGWKRGLAEGRAEGLQAGITVALTIRFGEAGKALVEELKQVKDLDLLQQVSDALLQGSALEDIHSLICAS